MTTLKLCRALAITAIVVQTVSRLATGAIVTSNPSLDSKSNGTNKIILNRPGVEAPGDFPPGPKPPADPWPLVVRGEDLDTPTLMVFAHFSDVETRNEKQLKLIIRKAISHCSSSQIRSHLIQPLLLYEWSQTRDGATMRLTITAADDPASRDPPYGNIGLTYNIWTNCLIAINNFRLAYPGVYFSYDIYIDAGGYNHLFVGYGTVSIDPSPTAPTVQATDPEEDNANQVATT